MLKRYFYHNLTVVRRMMQWFSFFLIILIPILNLEGLRFINGTYYSMSIGNMEIADPATVLQHILFSKQFYSALLLAAGIPVLLAFIFGKVFCSWACPFNLIAEYTAKLRWMLFPKKTTGYNKNPNDKLLWLIFGFVISIALVSGWSLVTILSFPGLISAQIADYLFFGSIGFELLLIALVLAVEFASGTRFWCKYACPVGAVLSLWRAPKTLSVGYSAAVCANQCPKNPQNVSICNEACPLQLNPRKSGIYPYCYNCGACVEACQSKGGKAIFFRFDPALEKGNHIDKKNTKLSNKINKEEGL
jgi:ferredoxin-type protein NapH